MTKNLEYFATPIERILFVNFLYRHFQPEMFILYNCHQHTSIFSRYLFIFQGFQCSKKTYPKYLRANNFKSFDFHSSSTFRMSSVFNHFTSHLPKFNYLFPYIYCAIFCQEDFFMASFIYFDPAYHKKVVKFKDLTF